MSSFASTFTPVPQASGWSHVQPISTDRCSGRSARNRVEPTTPSPASVTSGSSTPPAAARRASSTQASRSARVDGWPIDSHVQVRGSRDASQSPSACRLPIGSSVTWRPSIVGARHGVTCLDYGRADLRVRMHEVRGALRGARPLRGPGREVPELRCREGTQAAVCVRGPRRPGEAELHVGLGGRRWLLRRRLRLPLARAAIPRRVVAATPPGRAVQCPGELRSCSPPSRGSGTGGRLHALRAPRWPDTGRFRRG